MKKTFLPYSSALSVILMISLTAKAQENNKNIIEQEFETKLLQWNNSKNAAGLLLEKPSQNSNIEAGYSNSNGNFKQPQIGKNIADVFLKTKGNLYLKNYYLQGHFNYNRNSIKDAEYNASLIDPIRNMPYIVADTNSSDWLNQHYDLGFKVSTQPIAEKLAVGLSTNYRSSSGAKQRDIRAANYNYELQLVPSVVYSINNTHHIGANFLYKNTKEESSNSNVNTYVDQGYFFLFGLGNAINYVGSGRTMNYESDHLEGGVQYQYTRSFKLLAEVNYAVQAEDAIISFTDTRPVGTILMKRWYAKLNFQKQNEEFIHLANLDFTTSKSNGIEYITQYESGLESNGYYVQYKSTRSKYNNSSALLNYSLIKNKGLAYNWKANVFAQYNKLDNKYLIPNSLMLVENLTYGLSFGKLFYFSSENKKQLNIGAKVSRKNNLEREYSYTGSDANSITVTDLEQKNFEYYSANFTHLEIPITYSQRLNKDSNTQLFLKASGQVMTTNSTYFDNRKAFSFSVGATF